MADVADDLIDFSAPPAEPEWIKVIKNAIANLLQTQATITVHRSKLFSLLDDFRALQKHFSPNVVPSYEISDSLRLLLDAINRAKQVVYYCSAAHWSQPAISWSCTTMRDSVKRVREDVDESLSHLNIEDAPRFSLPEQEFHAQNQVDLLQLKGSLMEYVNHLAEQPQTPQVTQVVSLINERIRSIGPIEGLHEGPPLVCVPPFLPPRLALVLTHDQFEIGDVIGSGTFGSVHTGVMKATGVPVAVKVLSTKTLGGRQLETFKREVWTMATLNHPNILRLIGVTLTPPFCIVTEKLKCSLYDRLSFLTPTKRSLIALKVSQAMEALHAARIIHRDLKSANILLDEDDMPRVCDFGLVGFKTGATRTGYVGTAQWMAPEILRSSPFYDEKADVYSFGVLLWEMLTLQEPYAGMTQDRMVMAIIEDGLRPTIPADAGPPRVVELIKRCWAELPTDRPSFAQVSQALQQPEFHFEGTNEEEFSSAAPKMLLSQALVRAFDSGSAAMMKDLLNQLTRDNVEVDAQLLPVLMTLFPQLDSETQVALVHRLPAILDFELFVAKPGYTFVVSLLAMKSPPITSALVDGLRHIDLSAKCFRQVALINHLAHSSNVDAIALFADLCEYEDIAEHVVRNCLPVCAPPEIELYFLYVYHSVLLHKRLRARVGEFKEPLEIAARCIKGQPFVACMLLNKFEFSEAHGPWIVELDLINLVAVQSNANPRSLKVLKRLFAAAPTEHLQRFAPLIDEVVKRHRTYFDDERLMQKLSQISGVHVKYQETPDLIRF